MVNSCIAFQTLHYLIIAILVQGLFSAVMKDSKGSKTKQEQAIDVIGSAINTTELSTLFSMCNLSTGIIERNGQTVDSEDAKLDIGIHHAKSFCLMPVYELIILFFLFCILRWHRPWWSKREI